MGNFFVYVIWNRNAGKYYVGQTSDVEKRVAQHNDPENDFSKYTKRYRGAWELIHLEEIGTRSESLKRERELKTGKGREWLKANVLPPKSDGR